MENQPTNLQAGESVKFSLGVAHLAKNGFTRVFANKKQAAAAAERTGGEWYQSPLSNRFLVKFPNYKGE